LQASSVAGGAVPQAPERVMEPAAAAAPAPPPAAPPPPAAAVPAPAAEAPAAAPAAPVEEEVEVSVSGVLSGWMGSVGGGEADKRPPVGPW